MAAGVVATGIGAAGVLHLMRSAGADCIFEKAIEHFIAS